MKIIRGLHNLEKHKGSVVTIGNFDGVHLGHQQIIRNLVEKSKARNLPSVLVSFSPTPQYFFEHQQAALNSFKEKHRLLDSLGLDQHLIIHFNAAFSRCLATDFIQQILIDKLQTKLCLIGDDFVFGAERSGNFSLLQQFGFETEKTQSVLYKQVRISSSNIRIALKQGDFNLAKQMLGRGFSISGKIIHGQKKGRALGFPTINIPIKRKISPILGVFAVVVKLGGNKYNGVCNIGNRPSVGGEKTLLEVFVFDFSQNVYGQHAEVIFKHKIRNEQKFDSFDALKQQILLDSQKAMAYFA